MSYHLKYRPDNFDSVLGNEEVIESLKTKIEDKNRPHTYLFYGNSGCGKTTLARIMAKEFGGDEDYIIEINCSNENGVDTARDIIEKMKLKPLIGTSTIFILDELHMTSKNFQNALLKPLEDTPNYVYFFLCTTNPEKLLPAIKSRCSRFEVKPPTNNQMVKYLRNILKQEDKQVEMEVLKYLVEKLEVKPRECLIALENIVDLKDVESQKKMINKITVNESEGIELCRLLLKKFDWDDCKIILKDIEGEPESIRRMVLGYMSSVLLSSNNLRAYVVMDCFKENYFETGKAGLIKSCYEVFLED